MGKKKCHASFLLDRTYQLSRDPNMLFNLLCLFKYNYVVGIFSVLGKKRKNMQAF